VNDVAGHGRVVGRLHEPGHTYNMKKKKIPTSAITTMSGLQQNGGKKGKITQGTHPYDNFHGKRLNRY
jgi:hypothetical protein